MGTGGGGGALTSAVEGRLQKEAKRLLKFRCPWQLSTQTCLLPAHSLPEATGLLLVFQTPSTSPSWPSAF